MRRTQQWHAEQAAKQERELQQLVWPRGAPQQRSAAQALYPGHRTDAEWRSVGIARRPPQAATKPNAASVVYPNLARSTEK